MTILVEQTSSYEGNDRWNWQMWLSGPAEELDQIDHVTYTLHPSFPNPVREVSSRENGFLLKSNGWGEFRIYIDILGKDGRSDKRSHALKLEPPLETDTADAEPPSATARAAPTARVRPKDAIASGMAIGPETLLAAEMPMKTIFISGGIADTEAIDLLKTSLQTKNVRILSSDDLTAGFSFNSTIESLIDQADLAAFVVSGRPSRWVSQEIALAQRYGKRIVPVLVGESVQLPDSLSGLQSFRLDNADAASGLADSMIADMAAPMIKK